MTTTVRCPLLQDSIQVQVGICSICISLESHNTNEGNSRQDPVFHASL
jgi:hypothetical protein